MNDDKFNGWYGSRNMPMDRREVAKAAWDAALASIPSTIQISGFAFEKRWRMKDEEGDDLITFWKRFPGPSNEFAAATIIEELERDLAAAQANFRETNRAYCALDEATRELRGSHLADRHGRPIPAYGHAMPCNVKAL